MKLYEVLVIDCWSDVYQLGYYKNLDDAVEDINNYISAEELKVRKGDLKEYASTLSSCFDTTVYDIVESHADAPKSLEDFSEEDLTLRISGFILDSEKLIDEISKISKQEDL